MSTSEVKPELAEVQAVMRQFRVMENVFAISLALKGLPTIGDPAGVELACCIMGDQNILCNGLLQLMRQNPNAARMLIQVVMMYQCEAAGKGE